MKLLRTCLPPCLLASWPACLPPCPPACLTMLNQAKITIAVAIHRILYVEIKGKREGKDLESGSKSS